MGSILGILPLNHRAAPLGGFLIAAGILLAATDVAQARQEVVILCDEGYPPYSYAVNGEPKGIYTDILRAIFGLMTGYDVTIKPVPWKRALLTIENGSAFAMYPPYKRSDERPWMEYSDPILSEMFVVYLRADLLNQPRVSWPEDFTGLTLGKNAGFAVPENDAVKLAMRKGLITIVEAQTTEQNLLKLNMHRIDGYINDPLSIETEWDLLLREGKVQGVIRPTAIISHEEGYLGVTTKRLDKYPFREDFLKQFNKILADMKASGELDAIVRAHSGPAGAERR